MALKLIKHSRKVANVCADVIGDICGVLSGAISATIANENNEPVQCRVWFTIYNKCISSIINSRWKQ